MLRSLHVFAIALTAVRCAAAAEADSRCFVIEVVDAQTQRGVPLVELRTVNDIRLVTDSAGLVAFHEPGLMGRRVYFHVASHGYTYPKDGFGNRGKALLATPGATARLEVERVNIAERLYRVTGQGIYGHSVLAGRPAPLREPVLNGRVLGQDSVMALPYRGRLYWFWGDTNRESYPLGQFAMSGATSELPGKGGLDPAVGVDLTYFVDKEGFSRKMAPLDAPGPVWLDGLFTVADATGRTRLVAHYARMEGLGKRLEHGMMLYDDEREGFVRHARLDDAVRLTPQGQALRVERDGQAWWYFAHPCPCVRVRDDWTHALDMARYEAWTCLKAGSDYDKAAPALDRAADGRLLWGWKANTAVIDFQRQKELLAAKHIQPDEAWIDLRDAATRQPIEAHRGSVRWNAFRRRWVMILCQIRGTSLLGEIWYSEADAPVGPWRWARKVVTHDDYSFYNPVHHGFFDQQGGRLIYFEGTYTRQFSGARIPTARYDYNQVMYRLDLADPRLKLPE